MSYTVTRIKCSCEHPVQDKMYGDHIRIANRTDKEPSKDTTVVRCTVCKSLHTVNNGKLK